MGGSRAVAVRRTALGVGLALAAGCMSDSSAVPAAGAAGTALASAGRVRVADAAVTCPERVLAGMTRWQRVGQLFIAGVSATDPSEEQLRILRRRHVGGVILVGGSDAGVAAVRLVSDRVQARATSTAGVRLWVSADQEGGYVQSLRGSGFSSMPTALTQGTWSRAALRSAAHSWAGQLSAAGINLNLAPVMDTVPASLGTSNKPIGYYYREYGHGPTRVRHHGMAFLRGMRSQQVQTAAKHFPGLGRVRDNTDVTAGVTDAVTTRHDSYLEPFAAAVAAHVPMVMVSSARYSRIDDRHLAAFSPTVLHGMLRDDLGFEGVIVSDDLGQAAAVRSVPVGRRAVRFLRRGGTVVLTVRAGDIPTMVKAVVDRAAAVASFRARVDMRALRVLEVKDRIGLLPCSR